MNVKPESALNRSDTMNNKTYADLIKDHDYGWEIEPNLDELLLDYDGMITEAYNYNRFGPIVKGDIIMANNGVSERAAGLDILTPHRVFIIEDATGEPGHRIFKGYLISSRIEKANYNNKKFPNNIYINNYASILAKGPRYNTKNLINLSDLYVIKEEEIDEHSSLWKGHATQEFIEFIDSTVNKIKNGQDTSNIYWLQEEE